MGLIKQLKQFVTNTKIYPITKSNAVYDDTLGRLDVTMGNMLALGDGSGDEETEIRDADMLGGRYTAEDIDAINGRIDNLLTLTVLSSDDQIGDTIQITDGVTTLSKVVDDTLETVFHPNKLGVWVVTDVNNTMSNDIDMSNYYGDYTIKLYTGFLTWLQKAGITTQCDSLSELLEDEKTVRQCMTVHASCDYLVSVWSKMSSFNYDDFTTSRNAMKWIGLRDYIADKLLADEVWKEKLLASEYWEYILKDHVPNMTSNTAPVGGAYASSEQTSGEAWCAFSNNESVSWSSNSGTTTAHIGYSFVNPIKINCIEFTPYSASGGLENPMQIKVQASNDGVAWTDLTDTLTYTITADTVYKIKEVFENDNYYNTYRIYYLKNNAFAGGSAYCNIMKLNFYGRSLNESVPCMTSNTAPLGVASMISEVSTTNQAWYAFDKTDDSTNPAHTAQLGSSKIWWIQYEFAKPTVLKELYARIGKVDLALVLGSDDGANWSTVMDNTDIGATGEPAQHYVPIDNDTPYLYYRLQCTSNYYDSSKSSYFGYVQGLNFYGVSYSEEEFGSDGIEMLYDNGVEIVQHSDVISESGGKTEFLEDYISTTSISATSPSAGGFI